MLDSELPVGSTVGIIGGGQLGRMSALEAHRLGYYPLIFGKTGDAAFEVTRHTINHADQEDFSDPMALKQFASRVVVATVETENVPVSILEKLEAEGVTVHPSSRIIGTAQDRAREKAFAASIGIPPVPHLSGSPMEIWQMPDLEHYLPAILKSCCGGYDGKHQKVIETRNDLLQGTEIGQQHVLERRLELEQEISVLVARNAAGQMICSVAVANEHRGGILHRSAWSPRRLVSLEHECTAQRYAKQLAAALDLVGVLVVEFFVAGGEVFFNEMAPRPHNSFHASIEMAYVSQFALHVMSICGSDLSVAGRAEASGCFWYEFHSSFAMENLIGMSAEDVQRLKHAEPEWIYHWYGKTETRPDRKMWHRVITPIGNHSPAVMFDS